MKAPGEGPSLFRLRGLFLDSEEPHLAIAAAPPPPETSTGEWEVRTECSVASGGRSYSRSAASRQGGGVFSLQRCVCVCVCGGQASSYSAYVRAAIWEGAWVMW